MHSKAMPPRSLRYKGLTCELCGMQLLKLCLECIEGIFQSAEYMVYICTILQCFETPFPMQSFPMWCFYNE
ncbi:hypothetical protein EYC84_006616 [Monilinia fructicola]|uniref:Uncharacterized protein n=1 Tax=Monilinia fructicola TaxID=38448 RepID=A0A5M9K8F5_MONFR|nr:hypothetical protein EYC84_006616 [Monilinia fructicola]